MGVTECWWGGSGEEGEGGKRCCGGEEDCTCGGGCEGSGAGEEVCGKSKCIVGRECVLETGTCLSTHGSVAFAEVFCSFLPLFLPLTILTWLPFPGSPLLGTSKSFSRKGSQGRRLNCSSFFLTVGIRSLTNLLFNQEGLSQYLD